MIIVVFILFVLAILLKDTVPMFSLAIWIILFLAGAAWVEEQLKKNLG